MANKKDTSTTRPSEQSHTSDVAEAYCSVTDIKHYLYCPRILYFEKVMHASPILGSQQEASKTIHEKLEEKEKRRKAALFYSSQFETAQKMFRVPLESEKLKLRGNLDLLIYSNSEYIPVEYKEMSSDKGKLWLDHKYQLTAYALLVEETHNTTVKRGIVNYVSEDLVIPCEISDGMKKYVRRIVVEVNRLVSDQALPPVSVPAKRCHGGYGYQWICERR